MAMTISGDNGLTFPAGSTQVQAGNYQTMVNRIINGRMEIDQRNAGASVTNSSSGIPTYILDRWGTVASQASKFTIQQNAGSVTLPAGFINYLGVTSSSAYSRLSTDYFGIVQPIEGLNISDLDWGSANAKTITLSFWVRSSLTGTFAGRLANSASNRSYVFTYSISSANTWEQKTVTITGDTTGTWLTTNGVGIAVWFDLGSGSNYQTTAGSWQAGNFAATSSSTSVVGTNGATWYITGVDLRVGSYTVVPQDFRAYGTELALCQRYCYVLGTAGGNLSMNSIGANSISTSTRMLFNYPVTMRSAPTASFSAANTFLVQQLSPFTNLTPSAVTAGAFNTQSMHIDFTISGGTAGATCVLFDNTSAAKITVSAEL